MKGEKKVENLEEVRSRMKSTPTLLDLTDSPSLEDTRCSRKAVSGIVSDSRRVTPGSAFFALPGIRTDGNLHVEEALKRGAKTIITEDEDLAVPFSVTKVCVNDARKTLAKFSKRYYGRPDENLDLVGVTGTNGKTTVTTLTRHLLEEEGRPVGLIGTVRYHLGDREVPSYRTTPESTDLYSLLKSMLVGGCSEAVMEVSSHGIHQSRVSGLKLGVCVFLNLTRDHLDYHQNMETYFNEKRKIFNGINSELPKIAIINGDCPYGQRLVNELPPQVRVLTFGMNEENDFRARNLDIQERGTEFILDAPTGTHVVTSPMLGRFNVMNLMASLAVVHSMGRSVSDSIRKVCAFEGVDGRMESVDEDQGYKVVVDYAHTPDALRNALSMLRECTPGNLHVVFGCGGDRDRGKRMEMTRVACAGADKVWATSDNPRTESQENIFKDMRKGIPKGAYAHFIDDRRRAISLALDAAKEGDCVLIAGKGHESYQEVQYTAIPFDDRKVAGELLQAKAFA
ncbi:MAG: UDP-N-acetylmuramoyl-L-alanyl-D-glutamate--2,6-diaminopimelate ligase [Verrucomicrobia bacterium TMED44]|nr:MAG: UDP-N-acetylmuramoyl-L-alanyl-D-glutamate--2,6-diaminopimelate ligase [Verrucomicrobia bacterium TMED44]